MKPSCKNALASLAARQRDRPLRHTLAIARRLCGPTPGNAHDTFWSAYHGQPVTVGLDRQPQAPRRYGGHFGNYALAEALLTATHKR